MSNALQQSPQPNPDAFTRTYGLLPPSYPFSQLFGQDRVPIRMDLDQTPSCHLIAWINNEMGRWLMNAPKWAAILPSTITALRKAILCQLNLHAFVLQVLPSTLIIQIPTVEGASGRSDAFGRSVREEDDEEALKWVVIEKLPTYDRIRKGILAGAAGTEEVDIEGLGIEERRNLIERLVRTTVDDNNRFLLKLRDLIFSARPTGGWASGRLGLRAVGDPGD
ncbi:hypothetical protein GUJ93_ZPchr0001g30736 [Zizania palustris]|uniref:Uncharacterized protein n=1 Tax=Zizania palustris TaxID=103762 RepID=A0A8J5S057_ZIZPA|nr:hypothetical protein GUJ93_ZPchr0001g30736 [Zizania palustris]